MAHKTLRPCQGQNLISVFCVVFLAVSASRAIGAGENLLRDSVGKVSSSGSLAPFGPEEMIAGRGELRTIRIPPQDLVVEWESPVTFDTQAVKWDSEKVYASHYGLEWWDETNRCYRLVYEEKHNCAPEAVHRFDRIRTTKVRFTIFDHVLGYMSVIIKDFALYDSSRSQPGTE